MTANTDTRVSELIYAIARLSPIQRRQLLRRLQVSGLLDHEELLTDQNRVAIAPALGPERQQRYLTARETPRPATPAPDATRKSLSPPKNTVRPETAPPSSGPSSRTTGEGYRSPVSGRVVIGSPETTTAAPDNPHAMYPLPGQAPEQPIGIIFDGGSRGNPGQGYGSYALRWPGMAQQIVQLQFGDRVTNNEAEYDTLIAALEAVLKRLRDQGADPTTARLEIRGDSQLVVNQVNGEWQVRDERMKKRCDRAQELLRQFGRWRLSYHNRARSVDVLGH